MKYITMVPVSVIAALKTFWNFTITGGLNLRSAPRVYRSSHFVKTRFSAPDSLIFSTPPISA